MINTAREQEVVIMPANKKKIPPSTTQNASGDRNISIGGDVVDSVVIAGDRNKVNIIQKFFNIFKSDAETVDQRNRRIMLGHVENFWVKGILEKSLYGAALLDLGIKEDPDALSYPWAIKREANKETIPAGTSMLEIFQEIGMGRSLLILGAPGSGKTIMLLELTRQLIEHAREDVTEPIPVVFNLSSWTENLTLAEWLARELNVIYTIPKKVASTWVKENKMLLLLDGLDQVKQESLEKCVDAINQFRKVNGLTSMAVCSRIQDYAELKSRLSFNGAIEIQPLTSKQVTDYFNRFGNQLAGVRQILEKDNVLREIAETPLFLSIMTLAYRYKESKDILVSENLDIQRKHLLDTYIKRMFERPERSKNQHFNKQDILYWLSWLAKTMIEENQDQFYLEKIQPDWLNHNKKLKWLYWSTVALIFGLSSALIGAVLGGSSVGLSLNLKGALIGGFLGGFVLCTDSIRMFDKLKWTGYALFRLGLTIYVFFIEILSVPHVLSNNMYGGLFGGMIGGQLYVLVRHLETQEIDQEIKPGERFKKMAKIFLAMLILGGLIGGITFGFLETLIVSPTFGLSFGVSFGLMVGLGVGLYFTGASVIKNLILRTILHTNNQLPLKLLSFLDYCTDLIFLRRVGGGYIFVHRLLMEHFAAMYKED